MKKENNLINLYSNNQSHHWDDKKKAFKDYNSLLKLKKIILKYLLYNLNKIHRTHYSIRAWDLMIGYWLFRFLVVVFDRWTIISDNKKQNFSNRGHTNKIFKTSKIPLDSEEAQNFFFDDDWNNLLLSQILYEVNGFHSSLSQSISRSQNIISKRNKYKNIRNILKAFYNFSILSIEKKNVDYVITSSGLSKKNYIKLIYNLPGKKIIDPKFPSNVKLKYKSKMRNWQLPTHIDDTEFEKIVKKLIPIWIPMNFIEGFKSLLEIHSKHPYLKPIPKVIFTMNYHFNNDSFKVWAAKKIDKGSKLIIGQHGSGPLHKYNGGTKYEIDISDTYITTGNGNKGSNKLKGVGQIFNKLEMSKWDRNGSGLLVTTIMPRYYFDLRSMAMANDMFDYFKNQFEFYNNLTQTVKRSMIVRIPIFNKKDDYGWNITKLWIDKFPGVNIESKNLPFNKSVKNCRISIHTSNTTTFNETLAANIPTMVYWNKKYNELKDYSEYDISLLESVGIFHKNSISAANHLIQVWNKISEWWYNDELQKIRLDYCRKYAHRDKYLIKNLSNTLSESIKHKK